MQYKTIVLELLQQRPVLAELLRQQRRMLAAVEQHALELKESHETWKETLLQARPGTDESQIASEALEMALKDLVENHLPAESPPDEMLSLEDAMAFIRRRKPAG